MPVYDVNQRIAALEAERDRLAGRLKRISTLLKDNAPRDVYFNEDYEAGDHGCCGERSYEPHAPDCWFMECRALAADGENNDGHS